MLITERGKTTGLISGGCFEQDLYEKAQAPLASGQPQMITYDTTSPDDIIWGLGLGCTGIVYLLLEPLTKAGAPYYLDLLDDATGQAVVLATVFRIQGKVAASVGSRMMLSHDGTTRFDLCDSDLTPMLEQDCRNALASGGSFVRSYQIPNGSADVFIEVIPPPVSLLIFGAGPDALPLLHEAKNLGWHVTVSDNRAAYLTAHRFPGADALILSDPDTLSHHMTVQKGDVAVIMTHNYERDLQFLKELLPSPVQYIGLLGPKSKSERLLASLNEQGIAFTDEQVNRLFSPAGIDIGAETPEEIALAIIAEIQAVLARRDAGFLRERTGPIHEPHAKG
jgi:xanthine/CO dehydrogenase XdhC/CoxF family maturation factor